MNPRSAAPKDVDDYLTGFPHDTRHLLENVRLTIRRAAPSADEKISYRIPTFALHGNLVHFAGYKNHIGFYPGSRAIAKFKKELAKFETSRGTVQFPLDRPIPTGLIRRIVEFRVRENMAKAKTKPKTKGRSSI